MYYRRKIILALLSVFDGQLTTKQFQKYLFLFTRKQETKSFDFIPYRYGCFSFQANQDVATLTNYGYCKITEIRKVRFFELTKDDNFINTLKPEDRKSLLDIKEQFGNLNQKELIRYTYRQYPYYAIKSVIAENLLNSTELNAIELQKQHYSEKQLFTIGYEGISLETYINKLIINDVNVLCDVRKNAYSQKYGFSKKTLELACKSVDIEYIHIPDLGIVSDKRQELHTQADYDILFQEYEKTTLKENKASLLVIRNLLDKGKRVALTCFEKDPKQCHRTCVANALMQLPDTDYQLKYL
ncbi:MAG TPA: DUF488 family protein [Bacteroidales bacterium]|nr:DUF488 family protein [Bacteroidales bacterium]HOR81521.1 DUF488 family protein [Bacteroidales bacterium]HPJ90401.1 DUF488 family protein [Bacteroidales bacterium]